MKGDLEATDEKFPASTKEYHKIQSRYPIHVKTRMRKHQITTQDC